MVPKTSPSCEMDAPGHLPPQNLETFFFFGKIFTSEVVDHFEVFLYGLNQKRSWRFGVVNVQARPSNQN